MGNLITRISALIFTYPTAGGILKFAAFLYHSPIYLPMRFYSIARFWIKYITNCIKGKKTIIFSLSSPMEIQFVTDLLYKLRAHRRIEPVVCAGHVSVSIRDLEKLKKDFDVFPFGMLAFVKASLLISTKSALIWHKPFLTKKVHVFHSHASLHTVYSEGSFEDYDIFFATGPHHKRELEQYMPRRHKNNFKIYEIGSEKIDRLINSPEIIKHSNIKTIVFAPSWGETSSLKMAAKLFHALLANDYHIKFQPHPYSYMVDRAAIDNILKKFRDYKNFQLNPNDDRELLDADLLISDWSGIFFEFALGLMKPVILFNTPQKILNKNYLKYIPDRGVECYYRNKIGYTVDSVDEVVALLETIKADLHSVHQRIAKHTPELLYNPGCSVEYSYKAVLDILTLVHEQ